MGGNTASRDDREFQYTDQDFAKIRELIYARAGIALNASKRDMVYSRLARRLRVTRCTRFSEYLTKLERGGDVSEWEAFTNALTTNLTAFFREAHHFPILAESLANVRERPIRVWCAAASTGEEPYSIAITLLEKFDAKQVEILATDLDTNVLETASRGVYPIERIDKISEDAKRRFFRRGVGAQAGFVKVTQELRDVITFRQLNLLDADWRLSQKFDAIFCRNVMIYFDKPTQYNLLARFVPLLKPHALFFAGHSESFFHAADLVTSLGHTVYRPTAFCSAPRPAAKAALARGAAL